MMKQSVASSLFKETTRSLATAAAKEMAHLNWYTPKDLDLPVFLRKCCHSLEEIVPRKGVIVRGTLGNSKNQKQKEVPPQKINNLKL